MKKKETIRIIIEFRGNYAREEAINELSNVRQILMRRNPLDEPHVFCMISHDGKTWEIDDSL